MRPKMLELLSVAVFLMVLAVSVVTLWLTQGPARDYGVYLCLSFPIAFVSSCALLFSVPLRCPKPECKGRMERIWVKTDRFTSALEGKCSVCGETCELFTLEFGGGSWDR